MSGTAHEIQVKTVRPSSCRIRLAHVEFVSSSCEDMKQQSANRLTALIAAVNACNHLKNYFAIPGEAEDKHAFILEILPAEPLFTENMSGETF